jgi:hypothetical protein
VKGTGFTGGEGTNFFQETLKYKAASAAEGEGNGLYKLWKEPTFQENLKYKAASAAEGEGDGLQPVHKPLLIDAALAAEAH